MIIVWGSIETTAEHIDRALALSKEHVQRSRKEPGCITHDVYIDAENSNRLVFNEQWKNLAALHAHFAVAESGAFVKAISQHAIAPVKMKVFDATSVSLA